MFQGMECLVGLRIPGITIIGLRSILGFLMSYMLTLIGLFGSKTDWFI